ncbi:hypothetical protein NP233_g1090 [Leucocoprinus birnbaumii]|uniref:Uncharacterized protein n=1 Tax=Leucocoprinus birnbaumii TaxID=56174 RepID=A0AAD5W380_9AGAR|nr:hypothetical protein NP233_g1090 [Leucocoprinus birnbaumii]
MVYGRYYIDFSEQTTFSRQRYDPLKRSRPFNDELIGSKFPEGLQDVDLAVQGGFLQMLRSLPATRFGSGVARRPLPSGVGPPRVRRRDDFAIQHNYMPERTTTLGQRLTLTVKRVKKKTARGLAAMCG